VRLVLPVPPSWNRAYRQGKGRFYTPDTIHAFRQRVMVLGRNAGVKKFPRVQPVCISIWWFRSRQAGDLGKRCEVVLDALQGVWFVDDAQVAEEHLYRLEDKAHPRLEVEVTAIAKQEAA
jgi:Holliday junction resolvase RusA-like endonuclease